MANVKTPFDEPDLDSRSLFLYDPSSRAIDDHTELASASFFFSSSFFLLNTVAQPTFTHDHGSPELELKRTEVFLWSCESSRDPADRFPMVTKKSRDEIFFGRI